MRPTCAGPPTAPKSGPQTKAGGVVHHPQALERRVPRPPHGDRFGAYETVAHAVTRVFGASAANAARGVELCHDHGSQYLTGWFQGQSRLDGFTPSFAFAGEPETNGVVERFNRTIKEPIIHGRTYPNRAELATAVAAFVDTYNREWRLEKLRYQRPLGARRAFHPTKLLAA